MRLPFSASMLATSSFRDVNIKLSSLPTTFNAFVPSKMVVVTLFSVNSNLPRSAMPIILNASASIYIASVFLVNCTLTSSFTRHTICVTTSSNVTL